MIHVRESQKWRFVLHELIVHLHLCLLGCVYCLSTCWLGCHMFSRGKGITKVCAIQLQLAGEHMFLG